MRVSKEVLQECTGFHHSAYRDFSIITLWHKNGKRIELKYQSNIEYKEDKDFIRAFFKNTFKNKS